MNAASEKDIGMTKKEGATRYTSTMIPVAHSTLRDMVARGRSGRGARSISTASLKRSQIQPIRVMRRPPT